MVTKTVSMEQTVPPSLLQIISISSCNIVIWSVLCISVIVMLLLNNKFGEFPLEGNLNEASDVSVPLHRVSELLTAKCGLCCINQMLSCGPLLS